MSSHASEQREFIDCTEFSKRQRPGLVELPEKEAIDRAQRGDASAFARIYQLHGAQVYGLCLRMLGNTAEAEDLAHEAAGRARRSRIRPPGPPGAPDCSAS